MTQFLISKLEPREDELLAIPSNYLVMEFDEKIYEHYLQMAYAVTDVAVRIDKNISGLNLRVDYCVPQYKNEESITLTALDESLKQNNGFAFIDEQVLDSLPLEDNDNFEEVKAHIDCFTNVRFISESEYGGSVLRTRDIALSHLLIMLHLAEGAK